MSKSHSFSLYLLKVGFDASNSLKDGHALETAEATALPADAVAYILDTSPKSPWWRSFFGISKTLSQVSKGALIFLPVGRRCFAISFGHVFHHLKDEAYEYDFGLRVTLNAVDPNQLKSTDVIEPGSSRRQRTQLPTGSDLTYFDFDRDSTIIKSLVGKIKDEYKPLFRHATGSSNIRISSSVESDELPNLCRKLLVLYDSDAYKSEFPDIHNIEPVKDPKKIEQLNIELLKVFREKRDELYITVPDILNYDEGLFVSFSGYGESLIYDDLFTSQYYEYLEDNAIDMAHVTEEMLKNHRLNLIDENGYIKLSHRIYNCIAVDIEIESESQTYHLCDGSWYRVANSFINKLQTFLDPYYEDRVMLPYNHATEGKYNKAVTEDDARYICLDTTNIGPSSRANVEPCDLYIVEDGRANLCHVKVSTRSTQLSHLFNQGVNSVELIESDDDARQKITRLVKDNLGSNNEHEYIVPIEEHKFKIIYAIVTKKSKINKSKNLPLFSRISLMRSIKALMLMKTHVGYCFVDDNTEKKVGKKRIRKSKK